MSAPHQLAVIGAGPAGLQAASRALAEAQHIGLPLHITIFEAQRSAGRKFLVAGKSGLNLTNAESFPSPFLSHYQAEDHFPHELWSSILNDFTPQDLRTWANSLGFTTFESAGGKVFPNPMKAAPILRAWIQKLKQDGVTFAVRHRWTGLNPEAKTLTFETPSGSQTYPTQATILALGGASWPQTGSDGHWCSILTQSHHLQVHPLTPTNCGWETPWPPELLAKAEGLPLKNITARTLDSPPKAGELTVTQYGLEGGPLYHLTPTLRALGQNPILFLDLKPTLTEKEITSRLQPVRKNYIREARRRLKLSQAASALLQHLPQLGPWKSPQDLAAAIKSCPIHLTGPRPIAEAISSAGGISWTELEPSLMLTHLPGTFAAGEMLDWEAPTGGYLLQACFATGTRAGHSATHWLA